MDPSVGGIILEGAARMEIIRIEGQVRREMSGGTMYQEARFLGDLSSWWKDFGVTVSQNTHQQCNH